MINKEMLHNKISARLVIVILTLIILTTLGVLAYFIYLDKTLENYSDNLVWTLPRVRRPSGPAVILIDSDSITPHTVSINKGEQVNLINNDVITRRMAADPHPEHDSMPDLSLIILEEGESFTFTFKDVGVYKFHDEDDPFEINIVVTVK